MKCNRKYNRNKKAAASLLILSCLAAPSLAEEELPCRSHFWELANFPLADGSVCLLAVNKSDNDWNPMALVLSLEEGGDTLTPHDSPMKPRITCSAAGPGSDIPLFCPQRRMPSLYRGLNP